MKDLKLTIFEPDGVRHFVENAEILEFGRDLSEKPREIYESLLKKNIAYGDSELKPVHVFSNAEPIDGLLILMDDRLGRLLKDADLSERETIQVVKFLGRIFKISNGSDKDTLLDFIGYLILLRIAKYRQYSEAGQAAID